MLRDRQDIFSRVPAVMDTFMISCPNCENFNLKVIATRTPKSGEYIHRRVKCTQCEERFTTYELRALDLKNKEYGDFFHKLQEIKERKRLSDPIKRYLPPESWMPAKENWFARSCPWLNDINRLFHAN